MNKYNFKDGDYVEIYRKPVDGLGTGVSNLPPVGSKGRVVKGGARNYVEFPYVYISFDDGFMNVGREWAIPCSCLKRVKHIKAKAAYKGGQMCYDDNGNYCMYYTKSCGSLGFFPACSEEEIIYLKVKNAP